MTEPALLPVLTAAELREITPGVKSCTEQLSICDIVPLVSRSSESEVITVPWRAHLPNLSLGLKSGSSTLQRDRRELDAIL